MNEDESNQKIQTGGWRNWAIGFCIWTVIGLSFASRTYLSYYQNGANVSWLDVYPGYMIDFYLWGAASPFIFWLSRRFPVERGHLASRVVLHLLIALCLNFIVLATASPLLWCFGFFNKTVYPTFAALFR